MLRISTLPGELVAERCGVERLDGRSCGKGGAVTPFERAGSFQADTLGFPSHWSCEQTAIHSDLSITLAARDP
jgi:hypothetical protein